VLRGADSDVLLARTVEEMRRRKPGLESVEFGCVGHVPALLDAEQIEPVREFLLRGDVALNAARAAR